MTRPLLTLAALVLATAAVAATPYGEAITVAEATPIAVILDEPAAFAGREVRVEGEIHGVCAMAGCWIELADADGRRLRVKVDDGVIVFPPDAVGRPAVAQGTVRVREMSRADYAAWRAHLAEENGETFDPSTLGEGPFRLVQLAGRGATIGE